MGYLEEERLKGHLYPFVAITETWLKSYHREAQLQIPGYSVSRSDRGKRTGGGVLLYSLDSIPTTSTESHDDGVCQVLFSTFSSAKFCVAVVYRPPDASFESFCNATSFLNRCMEQFKDSDYDIFVAGDFNFPQINWQTMSVSTSGGSPESNKSAEELLNFMSANLMNQHVDVPTRGTNILDLLLSNNDRLVSHVTTRSTVMSDHDMVDIALTINPTSAPHSHINLFDPNDFRSLDFQRANFEKLNESLESVDWIGLRESCSFEDFPAVFTKTVHRVCQSHVPLKKPPSGKPSSYNSLRRKKAKLKMRLSAARCTNDATRIMELETSLNLVCYEIRDAIVNQLDRSEARAVARIKENPKFFFSYAKSFSKVMSSISLLNDKSGNIVTDRKGIADTLQEQFCSVFSNPNCPDKVQPNFPVPDVKSPDTEVLVTAEDILEAIKDIKMDSAPGPDGIPAILLKRCAECLSVPIQLLWSESMKTGLVPKFYKLGYVTPLHKKGSRAEPVNYRPVTLTSHIVKTFERVVRKSMVTYLETNELLTGRQHGFRAGRSTLTQLLNHFDMVYEGLVDGKDTDSIYLDYAKAFDRVDHELLISKLERYGFHSSLINWIKSFLTNRDQVVVLDGVHSFIAGILSGVPQGTVLGPLLFILFINDLELCVTSSTVGFFADDTRISKQIGSLDDCKLLQEDLDSVVSWSRSNNMQLHEQKSELVIHKHKPGDLLQELPFFPLTMSYNSSTGDALHPSENVRDLGVNVSHDLSWSRHICDTVTKARNVASWVLSVFKTRNKDVMLTLYKSLVRSILEFNSPVWNPTKVGEIQAIEGVQKTFTSRISALKSDDYWKRLKEMSLMSLQRRRERYIILQVWKILNGVSPNDIGMKFRETSRRGTIAVTPPLVKGCSQRNQSLYDSSFAVLGARLWNIVPVDIKPIRSFLSFKEKLSRFLASFPDNPPVRGYSCTNSNSLLDWAGARRL